MKSSKLTTALLTLCLISLSVSSFAFDSKRALSSGFSNPASSSKSNTSSSSYSKAFSTPKPVTSKSTGFGSFSGENKIKPSASASIAPSTVSKSKFSSGLEKNAAQTNALKTLEARESKKEVIPGFGRSSSKDNYTSKSTPHIATSSSTTQSTPITHQPAPVQVARQGNDISLGSAALGYMIGSAAIHDNDHTHQKSNETQSDYIPFDAVKTPVEHSPDNSAMPFTLILIIFILILVFSCALGAISSPKK